MHDIAAPRAMHFVRWGLSIHWLLVALTLPMPVYLTPELIAPYWVVSVQLCCTVLVLRQSTAWLAGVALIGLYALAVVDYGWFHLLDYPIFLGIGAILVLPKLLQRDCTVLCLDILRVSTAVTLLWGGIEKFAYPEWSFGMMNKIPTLSLGVTPETAMFMYGFGEVALSFALLLFGVGSQIAAALLFLVFVAAVPLFGWVDLVGHSGIIVALAVLIATHSRSLLHVACPYLNATLHGVSFSAVVAVLGAGYFDLHSIYLSITAPDKAFELLRRTEIVQLATP
jgi:uncharacterized membrane protein